MFRRSNPRLYKTQMSIEKCQVKQQPQTSQKQSKQLQLIKYSGGTLRYHTLAQQPITSDQTDKTILYKLPLYTKTTVPSLRKRTLVIRQLDYILCNWTGDGFPSVFYLCCPQLATVGYIKNNGQTSRIAALQLSQINPTLDDAQVRTYDLKYVLKQSVIWNAGMTDQFLTFEFKADNQLTAIVLPLPNPISLNFQMRYQLS